MEIKSELCCDKMGCSELICVYIIATHFGTYYTGITNNLVRRWKEHITGQSSYLSKFKAKEVCYVEFHESRRGAAKKEQYIKTMGAKNYMLRLKFRL